MKYYILLILALLLLAGGCVRSAVEDIDKDLAVFVGTRADAPLEGTVWECRTGEKFNRYPLFQDGEVSLFYGLVDTGELQRWSDFYPAPYTLHNGHIDAVLSYPLYGERILTESASVQAVAGAYEILAGKDIYHYYGPYTESLEDLWMSITVNIVPWKYD